MTLSSLAARIMARGEYPYRTRVVSPAPPHAPEPYPDEPFAPVYDYVPLHDREGYVGDRYPLLGGADRLVFGPQYARPGVTLDLAVRCGPCGVTWAVSAGRACWNCGRPG